MKVQIRRISEKTNECIIIECVEVTSYVESIRSYALAIGSTITGTVNERIYQLKLSDILYFEAVDERVFAYAKNESYELKIRLYELENAYADKHFVRCSKSFIINLMQLESISPALNGRFLAHLKNGETIVISRQYVPAIRQIVMGGK